METLWVELSRAKEQARSSNADALKAAEELRAEQAVHCESKEKIAKMAVELKDAADHYRLLQEENRAKATVTSQIFNLECYTLDHHAYHILILLLVLILQNPKQLKDPRRELGISLFTYLIFIT